MKFKMPETIEEWQTSIKVAERIATRIERERITKLLTNADTTSLTDKELGGWYFAVKAINEETSEK
jgi:hypothetical protein